MTSFSLDGLTSALAASGILTDEVVHDLHVEVLRSPADVDSYLNRRPNAESPSPVEHVGRQEGEHGVRKLMSTWHQAVEMEPLRFETPLIYLSGHRVR